MLWWNDLPTPIIIKITFNSCEAAWLLHEQSSVTRIFDKICISSFPLRPLRIENFGDNVLTFEEKGFKIFYCLALQLIVLLFALQFREPKFCWSSHSDKLEAFRSKLHLRGSHLWHGLPRRNSSRKTCSMTTSRAFWNSLEIYENSSCRNFYVSGKSNATFWQFVFHFGFLRFWVRRTRRTRVAGTIGALQGGVQYP